MAKFESVNFTNIDSEEFVCSYDSEEYRFRPGETRAFALFLTDHFTKHLVDKILLRQNVSDYSNPLLREPLDKRIRGEVVVETGATAKTDGQNSVIAKEAETEKEEEFGELKTDGSEGTEEEENLIEPKDITKRGRPKKTT